MTEIELAPLFALQKDLDAEIASNHHITYSSSFSRRLLALLVEVGEFANETRCFKYWSYKEPSPKEVILEEYVDGLHFLLSLGIPLGVRGLAYTPRERYGDLTTALLSFYLDASRLKENYDADSYILLLKEYLDILPLFGATSAELLEAYKKKMKENHRRQETNY